MVNNFVGYAQFYDLFNASKNYADESLYVHSLIKKFDPNASSIIDIGCGTGLHDIEFAKLKYNVVGIDISKEMIEIAKNRTKDSGLELSFYTDAENKFEAKNKFDVAVALFHVTSYQTKADDLNRFFSLAYCNLKKNGIFIIDYWFSPAVDFLKLEERSKSIIVEGNLIRKESKPTILSTNLFNIDITISHKNHFLTESHLMRSFVPQEFNQNTHFKLIDSFAWLTDLPPNLKNWSAVSILQKI